MSFNVLINRLDRLPNKPNLKTGSQRVLPSGPGVQKLVKAKSESHETSEGMTAKLSLKSVDQKKSFQKSSNDTSVDKTSILEISSAIETSISVLKSSPAQPSGQTSVQVMQLTDKIQLLRQSCKQYSDDCPPQQRFRFRELLNKVDAHCDQLKTTNTLQTNKLFSDIQNTLRDIVNLVQR